MALVLVAVAVLAIGIVLAAWKAYRWKIAFWLLISPVWLFWRLVKLTGFGVGKLAFSGNPAKVGDPVADALVSHERFDPANLKGLETLKHGEHVCAGGKVEAVHKLVAGMTGSGKNQADLNHEIEAQLRHSDEHLILLDAKPNAELSRIVYANAGPNDRIFVVSFHPGDRYSSSLWIARTRDEAADVAYNICNEEQAKDPHWNDKAAENIEAHMLGLSADESKVTATLNDVRDVVADRVKLEAMKKISPQVSNVADVEKEWGYIRSTTSKHLKPLSNMTIRRIFAGGPDTEQPDFSRRDGRDIVIVRPDPKSAKRLAKLVYMVLDRVYRLAAEGGDAGGPGTKVIVDEAASYMRLENLPEYLDLGRSSKVQLTYVLQGTKQLASKLGREEAEHVITSTELKVIGATSDNKTAEMISELSAPKMVQYRGPRQMMEVLSTLRERERPQIQPHEITGQVEGQFVIQHGPRIWKAEVPESYYHWRRAGTPREHRLWGYVDPEEYRVPPLADPDEGDGEEPEDAGERDVRGAERDDDWIA